MRESSRVAPFFLWTATECTPHLSLWILLCTSGSTWSAGIFWGLWPRGTVREHFIGVRRFRVISMRILSA